MTWNCWTERIKQKRRPWAKGKCHSWSMWILPGNGKDAPGVDGSKPCWLILCLSIYPKCGLEPSHSSAGWNLLKVGEKGRTWADGSHFGVHAYSHASMSHPLFHSSLKCTKICTGFQWFHRSTYSNVVFAAYTNSLNTLLQFHYEF